MNDFINQLKFDSNGLIPVIAQDYKTDEVLMLAYMNAESFKKTIETGKACYWSRSRKKLWLKGETSGHYQSVKSISIDCDNDTLLLKVEQTGAACHTGHHSCFYTKIDVESSKSALDGTAPEGVQSEFAKPREALDQDPGGTGILKELYDVIVDRNIHPREGSYTNYLFEKGLDKILKKVGEETTEVIIAAKNKSKEEIQYEVADLFYHIMVLLVERGMTLDDIYEELKKRR